MFGTQDFHIFLVAGLTLNLMPGPDTMYIIGRSIAQGRSAGFMSALGISTGSLVHTTAAAFGLSAILFASAFAFNIVKWVGAIYLLYLGIQMLFGKTSVASENHREIAEVGHWTIYRQGLLTNLFNPKVALFFMAFLPQFVAPAQVSSPVPFLFLGSVFITTGTLWCLFIASVAATASKSLRARPRSLEVASRLVGVVFIGLGIRLAFQKAQ